MRQPLRFILLTVDILQINVKSIWGENVLVQCDCIETDAEIGKGSRNQK
jgi:hypothetical protein